MKSLVIIFPDQLSKDNKVLNHLNDNNLLLLYEPVDTFYEISHHKHKLVFQISSFRHFINNLKHKNFISGWSFKNSGTYLIYEWVIFVVVSCSETLLSLSSSVSSSIFQIKPSSFQVWKLFWYFGPPPLYFKGISSFKRKCNLRNPHAPDPRIWNINIILPQIKLYLFVAKVYYKYQTYLYNHF